MTGLLNSSLMISLSDTVNLKNLAVPDLRFLYAFLMANGVKDGASTRLCARLLSALKAAGESPADLQTLEDLIQHLTSKTLSPENSKLVQDILAKTASSKSVVTSSEYILETLKMFVEGMRNPGEKSALLNQVRARLKSSFGSVALDMFDPATIVSFCLYLVDRFAPNRIENVKNGVAVITLPVMFIFAWRNPSVWGYYVAALTAARGPFVTGRLAAMTVSAPLSLVLPPNKASLASLIADYQITSLVQFGRLYAV